MRALRVTLSQSLPGNLAKAVQAVKPLSWLSDPCVGVTLVRIKRMVNLDSQRDWARILRRVCFQHILRGILIESMDL